MFTPKKKRFLVGDLPTPPKSVSKPKRMVKRPKHLETYELDPITAPSKKLDEVRCEVVKSSFDLDTSDSSLSPIADDSISSFKD